MLIAIKYGAYLWYGTFPGCVSAMWHLCSVAWTLTSCFDLVAAYTEKHFFRLRSLYTRCTVRTWHEAANFLKGLARALTEAVGLILSSTRQSLGVFALAVRPVQPYFTRLAPEARGNTRGTARPFWPITIRFALVRLEYASSQ